MRELVLYSPHITAHDVVLSPDTTPNLAHLTCLVSAYPLFTHTTLASPALETLEVIVTGLEAPADLAQSLANWTEMPEWPAFSTLKRFILATKRDTVLPRAAIAALRVSLDLAGIELDLIKNGTIGLTSYLDELAEQPLLDSQTAFSFRTARRRTLT